MFQKHVDATHGHTKCVHAKYAGTKYVDTKYCRLYIVNSQEKFCTLTQITIHWPMVNITTNTTCVGIGVDMNQM